MRDMGGLRAPPKQHRVFDTFRGKHVQPSVTMRDGLQIVYIPEIQSVEAGLARQQILADELDEQSATPSIMIWRCVKALLVTRSETRLPHFERAAVEMQASGWQVFLRKSGGGACPVGPGTVQVSIIEAAFPAVSMKEKYNALAELIQSALCAFQINSQTGSIPQAYCPGSYDLAVEGRKIAGMSQHWFRNRIGTHCIVTSASVNIEEPPDTLASVINRFYSLSGSCQTCQATAITNIRLCEREARPPGRNLALAFMKELASHTERRGGPLQPILQRTQRAIQ